MAYGLKYTCNFGRIDATGDSYTINIYKNNYGGSSTAIKGSAAPVVHTWENDEPKAVIKGSSLSISLVNENNIPLSDLYSVDDQEFKVIFLWNLFGGGSITLFEGFIVQDDSSEIMEDYAHEINLSANDNLGLLKDVPFNNSKAQPLALIETITDTVDGQAPNFVVVSAATYNKIEVGDTLVITSTGGVNGTFTLASKVVITGIYYLIFNEAVTNLPATSSTIGLYRPDMYSLRSLNAIIKSCLLSTGLLLDTRIFANINEETQSAAGCFLDQTLIDPQTFNGGSSWDNCYEVLTKVLDRFHLTLLQAKGKWNLVRWDEARYYDYDVPGFTYDPAFTSQPAQNLDESSIIFGGFPKYQIGIGEDSVAETGLMQTITRPFKFTKETFNYKQPAQLLRNFDLQQLGNLRTTYTTGSGPTLQTISEYAAPWWYYTNAYPSAAGVNGPADFFIRVIQDSLGNEIERYMVVLHNDIHSYQFEAGLGDIIKFSFRSKTTAGFSSLNIFIKLTDGTNTVFANEPGGLPSWDTTTGFTVAVDVTAGEWFSVETETRPLPFDGLVTVYLRAWSIAGSGENLYQDMRIEYIPMINQSSKIIGQTHTSNQNLTIKNTDEKEISIDSAPRNAIAGALFLNSLTGLLQTRCGQWLRSYAAGQKNLGEITTFENLFLRRIPRTLLEGTFYGLISSGNHLTPLAVCRYTFFPTHNFIFGRLEIDYRNNSASGTLYELYKDTEVDGDLSYIYLFQFLYATK